VAIRTTCAPRDGSASCRKKKSQKSSDKIGPLNLSQRTYDKGGEKVVQNLVFICRCRKKGKRA